MKRFRDFCFVRSLDDDESLVAVVHRHWLFGLRDLFWPTVALLLPWVAVGLAPTKTLVFVALAWSAAAAVWWMRNFLDYYLDAWLITDQGIIDIEWHGLFHREVTRVLYSDVQGVSYEIKGIVPTLLRFGTISIEKVSTGTTMELPDVDRPWLVEREILHCMEKYVRSVNYQDEEKVRDLLSTLIARQVQAESMEPKFKKVRRR